ncbi:MAG: YitT family protein [Lachnospiraceae bacterium]|nr:YitT family protein [Lachnospiraceae bacterium]
MPKAILKYLKITVAALIYSVSVSLFLDPNSLAPGGITGISIILNRISGISTGTWFLLLNIPLLLLGIWKFGIKFIVSTIYCTGLISVFTNMLEKLGAATTDTLLAAIAGGVLCAVGLGIVFKTGSTTGGTDIIVKALRCRFPHLKTSLLVLLLDVIVVIVSAFTFKELDRALYAGLSVFVISVVLDLVLYGRDGAKLIYIISDRAEHIAGRILDELEIGVTYINGYGAYSGKNKRIIMCVMRKNLLHRAEEIVKEEDGEAFMIVSSASEIYGEGYKNIFSEKI